MERQLSEYCTSKQLMIKMYLEKVEVRHITERKIKLNA